MIINETLNEKITIYEPQDIENREFYRQFFNFWGGSGISVEDGQISLCKKTAQKVMSITNHAGVINCFERPVANWNCLIWYDYLLNFVVDNNSYVYKIYLQDGSYYPTRQIIEVPYGSEMIKYKVIFTYIEGEDNGYLTIQPVEGTSPAYDGSVTTILSAITRDENN